MSVSNKDGQETEDYNKKYYLENKERILKRRKDRYKYDPEYRDKIISRALDRYFFEKKKHGVHLISLDEIEFDVRNMRMVFRDDKRIRFYGVKLFAKILDVTPNTVNNWHEFGVLPLPCYIENGFKKWYSEVYVENVKNAIKKRIYANIEKFGVLVKREFELSPDIDFNGGDKITDEEREELTKRFGEKDFGA